MVMLFGNICLHVFASVVDSYSIYFYESYTYKCRHDHFYYKGIFNYNLIDHILTMVKVGYSIDSHFLYQNQC